MRVLYLEDSEILRETVALALRKSGFAVDETADGGDGWFLMTNNNYDVAVLDIMVPKLDGLTFLKKLRKQGNETPVILLTAKDQIANRVEGFESGADDYLVKPFSLDELIARVRALTRRGFTKRSTVLNAGDMELNTSTKTVIRANELVSLTAHEFAVLEILMRNINSVISRRRLDEHFYEDGALPLSNVIDVTICSLRKKLSLKNTLPNLIHTRRGIGYVLEVKDEVD